MKNDFLKDINEHNKVIKKLTDNSKNVELIITSLIFKKLKKGGKILMCGNGVPQQMLNI